MIKKISLFGIALVCAFISFLALKNYLEKERVPKPRQTEWHYKLKKNKPMPALTCLPDTYYSFIATDSFTEMLLNGRRFDLKSVNGLGRAFKMRFDDKSKISLDFYLSGIWSKSGNISIFEGQKKNCPELVMLQPDKYSKHYISVSRGTTIEFIKRRENYYLGFFKGDKLVNEWVFKSNQSYSPRFWDDYKIRFKAAEVPFLYFFYEVPHREKLRFYANHNEASPPSRYAYYLKKGEQTDTLLWLDKGDDIQFSGDKDINKKTEMFINGKKCPRKYKTFDIKNSGPLSIKAIENVVINYIALNRHKHWRADFTKTDVLKIKVHPGDVLSFKSRSRFYIDGNVMEQYERRAFGVKKTIEITPGAVPDVVDIRVIKRKGY